MKALILSDSHGNKSAMRDAVEIESPGLIIHLGDCAADCSVFKNEYPEIPLRSVRGNCDPWSGESDILDIIVDGKQIFMTHGHLFQVKTGLYKIIDAAVKRRADILLFGHTHKPRNETKNGVLIVNPGSIGMDSRSYAILEIDGSDIVCEIRMI